MSFARVADIDEFVATLERYERGELTPGQWRAFRLVRGTYERYHSPDERELDARWLATAASEAGFSSVKTVYTDYFLGPLAWLAPRTPGAVAAALEALDNLALSVPLVRRYASTFSLCAS